MTENRILDHLKEIKRNLFEGKYTQDEKEHIEETLEALLHPNSLRDTNEAKRYLVYGWLMAECIGIARAQGVSV